MGFLNKFFGFLGAIGLLLGSFGNNNHNNMADVDDDLADHDVSDVWGDGDGDGDGE